MAVKLKALRSFEGQEGFIRRGDVFEVENADRANQLEEMKLAERSSGDVTNLGQLNAELDDMKKEDLEKTAEQEGVTYRDGATAPEIRTAIINQREQEHIKQQAEQTATERTNGDTGGETEGGQ